MSVLLYAKQTHPSGKKLKRVVETLISNNQKEFYHSIEDLSRRLRKFLGGNFIGVFLASDHQELADLYSLRHLLFNIRFILILPDRKKDTITLGHALRPRYLSYADEDFLAVAAVMCKMLENLPAYQGYATGKYKGHTAWNGGVKS